MVVLSVCGWTFTALHRDTKGTSYNAIREDLAGDRRSNPARSYPHHEPHLLPPSPQPFVSILREKEKVEAEISAAAEARHGTAEAPAPRLEQRRSPK